MNKKELYEEIYRDTFKNQLSRELELQMVNEFDKPNVEKMKDKAEREQHMKFLDEKITTLEYEMKARKYLLKLMKDLIK